MEFDPTGPNICAVVALGMSFAFLMTDRVSPTSRMLSLCLLMIGISILGNVNLALPYRGGELPWWLALTGLPEAFAGIAAAEWILRVRRTIPAGNLATRTGDNTVRFVQFMFLLYSIDTVVFYEYRINNFLNAADSALVLHDIWFYLFASPFVIGLLLLGAVTVLTLNRKPDLPEAIRLIGFTIGAPFMAVGLMLPGTLAPYATTIGLMILLVGGLNYHVMQGRRGAFMTRFLAPQVAQLVQKRGLIDSMQTQDLEIAVVACDLRGFTAYAEAVSSDAVIAALRDYYELVGVAAADHGATIKDYAGDGVLMLVGAPIAYDDNAQRALQLAVDIRDQGLRLLARLHREATPLGIGVGIATGVASVGIVGDERLEYAAVGSVVNRASRLCDAAASGEILVDARTRELLGNAANRLDNARSIPLKGLGHAVPVWSLA